MQLYTGSSTQFIEDTVQNRIAEKLRDSFFAQLRYKPSAGEVNSWRNSLSRMCNVIQYAGLMDHGVLLEYQLPLNSMRLDMMLTGRDPVACKPGAAIIELKQWGGAEPSKVDHCVTAYVGGAKRRQLHPSRQVGRYHEYLADLSTAFTEGDVALASCAYLHNLQYDPSDELFHPRHADDLAHSPLFAGDQTHQLAAFLKTHVGAGDGQEVLREVLDSKYRPGKKLLDHTAAMVKGEPRYVLLDEQDVVFNTVLAKARESFHRKGKVVILVKGGPGTGKSVIALNLVGGTVRAGLRSAARYWLQGIHPDDPEDREVSRGQHVQVLLWLRQGRAGRRRCSRYGRSPPHPRDKHEPLDVEGRTDRKTTGRGVDRRREGVGLLHR